MQGPCNFTPQVQSGEYRGTEEPWICAQECVVPVYITQYGDSAKAFQSNMTIKQKAQREGTVALADPALLDKIDQLFACNVGKYIDYFDTPPDQRRRYHRPELAL